MRDITEYTRGMQVAWVGDVGLDEGAPIGIVDRVDVEDRVIYVAWQDGEPYDEEDMRVELDGYLIPLSKICPTCGGRGFPWPPQVRGELPRCQACDGTGRRKEQS